VQSYTLCVPNVLWDKKAAFGRSFLFGAPGMGIDLEVEILSRAGHSERSEPQSVGPRGRREGSGERSCGPTNRNRIEGGAGQGERAKDREAVMTKARRRRSGGRAAKVDVLTPGRSRLAPERATAAARPTEREVSRGRSSSASCEGPNDGKGETPANLSRTKVRAHKRSAR
jgi:hypothetical protein